MVIKKVAWDLIVLPTINLFINEIYGKSKGILDNIRRKKIKNNLMKEIEDDLLKLYGDERFYDELSHLMQDSGIYEDTYKRCYLIENNDFKTNDEFLNIIIDKSNVVQADRDSIYSAIKYIFDKTLKVLNENISEDTRITINEIRIVRNDIKRLSSNVEKLSNDLRLNDNQKLNKLNSENKKLNSENIELKEEKKEKEKKIDELSILLKELEEKINRMEGNGIAKLIRQFKSKFEVVKSNKNNLAIIRTIALVLTVIALGLFWMSLPKKREITTELISYSDISLDYLKNINTTDSETVRIDFYDVIDVNNIKVIYNNSEIYEYDTNYFDILPKYLDQVVNISVSIYHDNNLLETLNLDNVYVVEDYNTTRIANGVERIYFTCTVNSTIVTDLINNKNLVEIFFWSGNGLTSEILSGLINLKSMYIGNTNEKDMKFLRYIINLENLQIYECYNLKNINSLEYLSNLRILELRGCSNLSEIKGLTWLTNLVSIDIIESSDLVDVSAMHNLVNLERLNIYYCYKIKDISAFENLIELRYLYLIKCHGLESITALKKLKKLDILNLDESGNFDIREILALNNSIEKMIFDTSMVSSDLNDFCNKFTNLKVLYMNNCDKIDDLSSINKLINLEKLRLKSYGGESISSLDFDNSITNINTLDLISCNNLMDINTIKNIDKLENLNLSNCGKIEKIECLSELRYIRTLNLGSCININDISKLSGLNSLEYLYLNNCINISDISSLAGLNELEYLNLYSCESINDISILSGLNNLEYLDLSYCSNICDISSLAELSNLEYLKLYSCEGINDYSPLSILVNTEIYGVEGY